jgi:hypothetical protein
MAEKKVCGARLVVQRYGMGLRYYCPECDVSGSRHHERTISWTNGPLASNERTCKKEVSSRA